MNIAEVIGWVGALLFVLAYLLLISGKLSVRKTTYHWMNAIGGFCLVLNAVCIWDLPTIFVNLVWSIIAFFGIYKIIAKTNRD